MDSRTINLSDVNCDGCGLPNHLTGGLCVHCRNVPRGQRVPASEITLKSHAMLILTLMAGVLVIVWGIAAALGK